MGIWLDIFCVLMAENWPCAWESAMALYSSKFMEDKRIDNYCIRTTYFNPPVRCLIKAGAGGVVTQQKQCSFTSRTAKARKLMLWTMGRTNLSCGALPLA